jgi:hypothetical protein
MDAVAVCRHGLLLSSVMGKTETHVKIAQMTLEKVWAILRDMQAEGRMVMIIGQMIPMLNELTPREDGHSQLRVVIAAHHEKSLNELKAAIRAVSDQEGLTRVFYNLSCLSALFESESPKRAIYIPQLLIECLELCRGDKILQPQLLQIHKEAVACIQRAQGAVSIILAAIHPYGHYPQAAEGVVKFGDACQTYLLKAIQP